MRINIFWREFQNLKFYMDIYNGIKYLAENKKNFHIIGYVVPYIFNSDMY